MRFGWDCVGFCVDVVGIRVGTLLGFALRCCWNIVWNLPGLVGICVEMLLGFR